MRRHKKYMIEVFGNGYGWYFIQVLAGNGRVMLQSEGVQSKAQAVRTAHDLNFSSLFFQDHYYNKIVGRQ